MSDTKIINIDIDSIKNNEMDKEMNEEMDKEMDKEMDEEMKDNNYSLEFNKDKKDIQKKIENDEIDMDKSVIYSDDIELPIKKNTGERKNKTKMDDASILGIKESIEYDLDEIKNISWDILDHYFKENKNFLVSHHIDSYNNFINKGIFNIFKENGIIKYTSLYKDENDQSNEVTLYLGGKDPNNLKIYFGKPVIFDDDYSHLMYPNDARLRNMNYAATIHFDVDVDFVLIQDNGEKITHSIVLEKIYLGKFHIMLQSTLCILHGLDRKTRFQMGECLNDFGGYFIVDGKEKVIVSQETFADNMMYTKIGKEDDIYSHSIDIRSKSEDTSKPIRTTSIKIVSPNGSYTNKQIVVLVPNIRKPVPLFILMRALGITNDEAIIKTCLLDLEKNKHMVNLFLPSIHDAAFIYTQEMAINYLVSFTKRQTISGVMEILSDYFLPHIGELNFVSKAYFVGYMTYKLLKVYTKEEAPTDRDNFQFKRVELTGDLLYSLFREYFLIYTKSIRQNINKREYFHRIEYEKNFVSLIESNVDNLFISQNGNENLMIDSAGKTIRIVEDGFRRAFKGNWGSQENTKRTGVVQDLDRLSWYTFMSHLRKINLPIDSSAKVIGPRLLNPSQWGFIDPIDTPDGANIGLHKHLALGCKITSGFSSHPIIKWLRENMRILWLYECEPEIIYKMSKVFVNGNWIGVINNTLEVEWILKLYRRNGILPVSMSISFDYNKNELHLYTDSGRLTRPIYYIMKSNTALYSIPLKTTNMISHPSYKNYKKRGNIKWQNIITGFKEKGEKYKYTDDIVYNLQDLYPDLTEYSQAGIEGIEYIFKNLIDNAAVIDYVDTAEENSALIALNSSEYSGSISASTNKSLIAKYYTHIEIEPSIMLGVMGNSIIFPENNPLTRNAFSCGQSKQAVSYYNTNYPMRMDKMSVVLNYGQIPLIKSRLLDYMNNEEQPYGINTIVAIMCYTGYNVEDAILINEGALKRGLFRTTYYTTYESHEESSKVTGGEESKFANIEKNNVIGIKPGYDYSQLDDNGMIKEGTPINDKTVLIGKIVANLVNKSLWIDSSETPKKGQLGFVDKAFITEGEEGFNVAKVRVYESRTPDVGDKFASRSGQKGTIGCIIPEADMPYTSDGVKPHIIINPHAIPSRMTVGQIIESLLGKICQHYGTFGDCTAYQSRGINYYTYARHLLNAGYSFTGNEVMYNGMTGEQIKTDIYIGPTYYMRLKHMVKDKINHRSLGPRSVLTRQTVGGRANDGGLRIGEMERDGILAHGMSSFLNDSFLTRGDDYYMAICNKTGIIAIYNESRNLFLSPYADGPLKFVTTNIVSNNVEENLAIKNISRFGNSFSIVRVPYAFKLFIQELQSIFNIQTRIITDQNIGQLNNMAYSFNMDKLMTSNVNTSNHSESHIKKQIKKTSNLVMQYINKKLNKKESDLEILDNDVLDENLNTSNNTKSSNSIENIANENNTNQEEIIIDNEDNNIDSSNTAKIVIRPNIIIQNQSVESEDKIKENETDNINTENNNDDEGFFINSNNETDNSLLSSQSEMENNKNNSNSSEPIPDKDGFISIKKQSNIPDIFEPKQNEINDSKNNTETPNDESQDKKMTITI